MKKCTMLFGAAMLAVITTGCICDGTEQSFREIDRKYAESAWSAAAIYTPIFGPLFIAPPMMAMKRLYYYRVLLKKPDTEAYEVLRYSQPEAFTYWPEYAWRY